MIVGDPFRDNNAGGVLNAVDTDTGGRSNGEICQNGFARAAGRAWLNLSGLTHGFVVMPVEKPPGGAPVGNDTVIRLTVSG